MQEKEKRKYDRYLEKKRERQLKREREKIEKKLAEQSEEARLTTFSSGKSRMMMIVVVVCDEWRKWVLQFGVVVVVG